MVMDLYGGVTSRSLKTETIYLSSAGFSISNSNSTLTTPCHFLLIFLKTALSRCFIVFGVISKSSSLISTHMFSNRRSMMVSGDLRVFNNFALAKILETSFRTIILMGNFLPSTVGSCSSLYSSLNSRVVTLLSEPDPLPDVEGRLAPSDRAL